VRAYAAERLAETGQADRLHQQHTQYFLRLIENCAQSPEMIDQLDENHDNIRAAIAWSLHVNETDITLRMLEALRSLGRQ
jgi:predicted ATPase